MRVYLDTSSIINLIERRTTNVSVQDFGGFLRENQHTLVYSFPLVLELIEPMWNPDSDTVVTRTLNALEDFPHEWIDTVGLPNKEVRLALRHFVAGQEYGECDLYVRSFGETFVGGSPKGVRLAIHYPLAEAAFDLRNSGTFDPIALRRRDILGYQELIRQERQLLEQLGDKRQARRRLFTDKIAQRVRQNRLYEPEFSDDPGLFGRLGEHVADRPDWCPAVRLGFEMFHALVDNVGDKLDDGDLLDMSHTKALPYVDLLCMDRRISDYVARASQRLGIAYDQKIRRGPDDLLEGS